MVSESKQIGERRCPWAAALVCVLVLALRLWAAGRDHPADDAFITYRYAANLAHGQGFVFNPGEPVLGTTTPLLTLLLALPGALGLDVAAVGVALCLVLSAVSVVLLFELVRSETGSWVGAGAGATWLAVSAHQTYLALSGMETTLLLALMLGSYLLLSRGQLLAGMILAGLTAVTRPEGVVWLVMCSAALLLCHRRQAWLLLPAVLPLAVWTLFACVTFGSLLPQSVMAKRLQGGGPTPLREIWLGLLSPLGPPRLLVVLVLAGLALALRRDRLLCIPVGFSILFVAAYLWGRPALYPWYPGPLDGALAVVAAMLIGRSLAGLQGHQRLHWRHVAPLTILLLFGLLLYHRGDGMYRQLTQQRRPKTHRELAEWTRTHTTPHDVVLVGDVGYIGYYNLDRRVYDYYGLVWDIPPTMTRRAMPEGWQPVAVAALRPTLVISDVASARGYDPPGYTKVDLRESYVVYRRR